MNNTIFAVDRNIESLEEIVDEVPAGTTGIICLDKGLRSLRGIENLSSIKGLYVSYNQITSLKELSESSVTKLHIFDNPCSQQFYNEFEGSVENVKEYYNQFLDTVKDPGFD